MQCGIFRWSSTLKNKEFNVLYILNKQYSSVNLYNLIRVALYSHSSPTKGILRRTVAGSKHEAQKIHIELLVVTSTCSDQEVY